jgi:hypothetical protein
MDLLFDLTAWLTVVAFSLTGLSAFGHHRQDVAQLATRRSGTRDLSICSVIFPADLDGKDLFWGGMK